MDARSSWLRVAGIVGLMLGGCRAQDTVLTADHAVTAGQGGIAAVAGSAGVMLGAGGVGAMAGAGGVGGSAGGAQGGSGVGVAGSVGDDGSSELGGTGATVDAGPRPMAQDPDCDLNGIWIVQQITVSSALGAPQYKNAWSYQEIEHEGGELVITKQFDCGGEVKGTIHVTLKDGPTAAMMTHNDQSGRTGTMKKASDGTCELTLDTFWGVRGASEAMFVPAGGRNVVASLSQLQAQRPLPTQLAPAGAEDWDMDGYTGLALDASGAVTGTRHSVQRDWSKAYTDSTYTITPASDWTTDLVVRMEAEAEDSVFATEPAGNLLLAAGTVSEQTNVNNRLIMRFLGRDASDPRVSALPIAGTDPHADAASALATCYAIQDAMPALEAR